MNRSDMPWPIRDIANFFVYRKIVKELNADDPRRKDYKKLKDLQENIDIMGFNDGVESFETKFNGQKLANQAIVKAELKRKAKEYEREARRKEKEKYLRDPVIKKKKKKEPAYRSSTPKQQYDPSWTPTVTDLLSKKPRVTKYPYQGVTRREYDIKEKGAYVIAIDFEGGKTEVLKGKSALEVGRKASELIENRRGAAPRNEQQAVHWSEVKKQEEVKKKSKPKSDDDDFDIDISHVNRAMGNDGSKKKDDDVDDLLDDIF